MTSPRGLYARLFRLCARLNLPRVAALLALPTVQHLRGRRAGGGQTVLLLPKDGFTQDALAALDTVPHLAVAALPREILHQTGSAFLPYFVDDNNYASCGPEFDVLKLRFRKFLATMFGTLRPLVGFDAILTGNFGYAQDRELSFACGEIGVSFIALHKENLKTPGRVAFFERVYRERRGPFGGQRILVYNDREKSLQVRAGVAGEDMVEVVGMPRLDRLHAWRRDHAGTVIAGSILFFMFSSVSGMPRIPRKTEVRGQVRLEEALDGASDISLARLCRETCAGILDLAREHPEITVVVKTKGRQRDIEETLREFGIESEPQLPGNLRLVHGGDVLSLIAGASVVCGFNSTALLEAVAAGKPVVLPWFAEALEEGLAPYVIDLRKVSSVANDAEQLARQLLDLARNPLPVPPELSPPQVNSLEEWTGNGDGRSAARAGQAIVAAIAARGVSPRSLLD